MHDPRARLADLRQPKLWGVALALGAITMMWTTYNEYVPQFLRGTFGLPAIVVAFVLTADNVIAFFLEPLAGLLSDRTRTMLGKRLPWLLVGVPLAVTAFALLPVPLLRLAPSQAALRAALNPFGLAVVGTLVAMALFRTPTTALMPDLAASPQRALANGLLQALSGLGALGALWSGGWLVSRFGPAAPFWLAATVMVGAALVLWVLLAGYQGEDGGEELPVAERTTPRRELRLVMGAISASWLGFIFLNAFFGNAATARAGLSEGAAELLLTLWLASSTLAAVPVGLLADRTGRRRVLATSSAGMAAIIAFWTLFPLPLFPSALLLLLAGVGWAGVIVSTLPMLLDMGSESRLGTRTGLYYLAFAAAGIAGPWLVRLLGPLLDDGALWLAPLCWLAALGAALALRPGAGEPAGLAPMPHAVPPLGQ